MAQAFVLGNSGASIPSGGSKGAVLIKSSDANFDMNWSLDLAIPDFLQDESSVEVNQVLKIAEDEEGNKELAWGYPGPEFQKEDVGKVLKIGDSLTPVWGLGLPSNGVAGQSLVWTDNGAVWQDISLKINVPNSSEESTNYYILGSPKNTSSIYKAIEDSGATNNTGGIYFNNKTGVLRGAAWNDYAEFRLSDRKIKPGICVIENGDDKVRESDIDMAGCAYIVSDTYGVAIGEEEGTVPVALSGKVLAYTEEPQQMYRENIGRPVCASANGKIRLMTSEEAREKPWCILGVVSSVPNYNVWGITLIQVDGRVWIKVR